MKKWGKLESGEKVRLHDIDPDATPDFRGSKAAAEEKRDKMRTTLDELQELMWAEHRRRLLIVLQGMDTAGKDGTIRYLMDGFNAASVRVASFKKPTAPELDHDFLWRIHQQVPGNGEIVIFNRSHYEDVLIVRVHEFVPEDVWRQRYEQINDFERMLTESGTTILKFFLHISKDEQKERLQERVADPQKHWKFNAGDLEERKLWDEYQKAYEDALEKTTTDHAPWYIVPANRKWYRNYVIGSVVIETMKKFRMKYPTVDVGNVVIE
ncbi:MAG: polyphosphate kinase [Acidobacteria bacterium]|nr:MAG: polyphosphate kinase [Acidobacteriota bacterium]